MYIYIYIYRYVYISRTPLRRKLKPTETRGVGSPGAQQVPQ